MLCATNDIYNPQSNDPFVWGVLHNSLLLLPILELYFVLNKSALIFLSLAF